MQTGYLIWEFNLRDARPGHPVAAYAEDDYGKARDHIDKLRLTRKAGDPIVQGIRRYEQVEEGEQQATN